jgi:hypothetical protein
MQPHEEGTMPGLRIVGLVSGMLAVLSISHASAQERTDETRRAKLAVYGELGGPTGIASLNIDRLFVDKWALRLGLDVTEGNGRPGGWSAKFPLTLSHVSFTGPHGVEVGGGTLVSVGTFSRPRRLLLPLVHVGYRYQPIRSGLFFRAELLAIPRDWAMWAGIGFGYAFR